MGLDHESTVHCVMFYLTLNGVQFTFYSNTLVNLSDISNCRNLYFLTFFAKNGRHHVGFIMLQLEHEK